VTTSLSQFYPYARQLAATTGLAWTTSNVKVLLMADGYVPNFSNTYLSDVQAAASGQIIATSGNIQNPTAANGYLSGNTIGFGVLSTSLLAGSFIFYKDTGVATTSPLLFYVDTPDVYGFPENLNGFNYYLYQNPVGGWARL